MRAFLLFLAAIVATLLVAAALAYPLYLGIHALQPAWWFERIATRLWQLLMLGAIVWVVRRLRLDSRRDWGYGAPRPRWLRQFGLGLAAGLATMLPVTVSMLALGVRAPLPDLTGTLVANAVVAGLFSGLAVGFLEETFFRGLMQGAVLRDMHRPLFAILLVSVVYAALHFLARVRIPPESVSWHSGFTLLGGVLANVAAPAAVVDSFLSLVAVGLLLGLVTWWTGSIACAVGLHAGWVWVIRTTVGATSENHATPFAWLISRSDGYTGWLVLAWTLALTLLLVALRGRLRASRRTD
jgi:membrane protease YdiL (CAAX protease family)